MIATHKNAGDGSIPAVLLRIRLYRLKGCRTFCGASGPTEEWLHFRGLESLERVQMNQDRHVVLGNISNANNKTFYIRTRLQTSFTIQIIIPSSASTTTTNNSLQSPPTPNQHQTTKLFQPTFKMQFSTAIIALAAAMGASADAVFAVSDFSASCVPHSSQCM